MRMLLPLPLMYLLLLSLPTRADSLLITCLLYTSPSPRDYAASRMPSSA